MQDMIFRTEDRAFSYRVGGILIHNGKVLLQQPVGDKAYSIPGGHVSFGETTAQTVVREFKEEIDADIEIERLLAVAENFFPWGKRACHQAAFYYLVSLCDETQIQTDGIFRAYDELGGERYDLDFCWIPLEKLDEVTIYPEGIGEVIKQQSSEVKHLVVRQTTVLD